MVTLRERQGDTPEASFDHKPRRLRCYCVGTGKTGTMSIAGLFRRDFSAAHEPASEELVRWISKYVTGEAIEQEILEFVRDRDKGLGLDVESDGTLAPLLPFLVSEFPDSRFILTVRDCFSWLHSMLDHAITRKPTGFWLEYDDIVYRGMPHVYPRAERDLQRRGLRPLDHYLAHWSAHIDFVVANTPQSRLLILRTDKIGSSAPAIASFLGITEDQIDVTVGRLNVNYTRTGILQDIGAEYVASRARLHCSRWMNTLFPDISMDEFRS